MRRLRIVMRGGSMFEIDINSEWNLDTDLLRFAPPDDAWTERLRYISTDDIIAIVELREPIEFE